MRIALASANKNKCHEIKSVAKEFSIEILSLKEIEVLLELPPLPEIEETGVTYKENAFIKAKKCLEWCGLPSLGDDSGLEVSALGGAPGIYSARYAGEGASDEDKIEKILKELSIREQESGIIDRSAQFRAMLCFIQNSETEPIYFEGILEGRILDYPRGHNGFGYDPIVHITELGGTLAKFESGIICSQGFRAKAAKKLFSFLKNDQ